MKINTKKKTVKCTFCNGTGKRIVESGLENLGFRIATIRINRKMTQGDLAEKMGYSRTSITNLEAGRQDLPLHKLYELAEILGVDAGELV